MYWTSPVPASKLISPSRVGIASLYISFFATLFALVNIDTVMSATDGPKLLLPSEAFTSGLSTKLLIQLYISVYALKFSSSTIIAEASPNTIVPPVNGTEPIRLYGTSTVFIEAPGCWTDCAKYSRFGIYLRLIDNLKPVGCKKFVLVESVDSSNPVEIVADSLAIVVSSNICLFILKKSENKWK